MTSLDLRLVSENNKDDSAIHGIFHTISTTKFLIYSNQLIRFLGSRITLDENADKRKLSFFFIWFSDFKRKPRGYV